MKTHSFSAGALLFAALSLPGPLLAEFKVHEWGTFTVLQGSDGIALRWYQSERDQYPLPRFVHPGFPISSLATKRTAPDGTTLARMETPVVYFYPDEEINVSVTASLPSGRLTEWFPDALRQPSATRANSLQWIGRLLPPDSAAATEIPRTNDDAGRHYDAARAVPDAWVFRSALPKPVPKLDTRDYKTILPPVPEVDRLLFYRGAADIGVPIQITTGDDRTFSIANITDKAIPAAFALQVSAQGVAWTRVDGIQPVQWVDGQRLNIKAFTFPAPKPKHDAIAALRTAVRETLVTEGLTSAEAAAMLETWQGLWFAEAGTRVLSILPEEWINGTVPLTINPAPARIDRVYVLRSEILTKAREEALADLLAGTGDSASDAARYEALELGRFGYGALSRSKTILVGRQDARFNAWVNASTAGGLPAAGRTGNGTTIDPAAFQTAGR